MAALGIKNGGFKPWLCERDRPKVAKKLKGKIAAFATTISGKECCSSLRIFTLERIKLITAAESCARYDSVSSLTTAADTLPSKVQNLRFSRVIPRRQINNLWKNYQIYNF